MKMNSLHRGRCLCGIAYVCAFLFLASVLLHRMGFPLDDSWIHQVIARNFALYRVLGFYPGKLTSGSTSLLWSCLLAVYWRVLPGVSPVLLMALTNALLLGALGYVLKAITEEDALPAGVGWCVALAPVTSGNLLWFGMTGMEHVLFMLLSLCLIRLWYRPAGRRGRADLLLIAAVFSLLILTRPEGLFFGLLMLATARHAQRSLRSLLAAAAGLVFACSIFSGTSWMVSRSLFPQTMQARQFLYSVSSGSALHQAVLVRLEFLGLIVARCLKTWNFYASRNLLHHRGLLFGVPLVFLLAALALIGLRRLVVLRSRRMLMLCMWAALIVALYTAVLPSTGHGGRYIAVPLLLFMPLELLGLHGLLSAFAPTRRYAWPLVVCVALLSATRSLIVWRQATIAQIAQIESEHGAMASWLQDNFLPSDFAEGHIAVFDIGRIGFQLHGQVLDLGGLMDRSYLPYVFHGHIADYLAAHDVRYVVLPSEQGDNSANWIDRLRLDSAHGITLVPLHSICVTPQIDRLAENSASTAYACQRAYKLVYSPSLAH